MLLSKLKALLPSPKLKSSLNPNPFLSCARRTRIISSSEYSTETHQQDYSFTVSYLINSCGLSPESAISASRRVKFESSHNPDTVLNLLKARGFNEAQISRLVKRLPEVLVASPKKTLLPKLNFFKSIGVSEADFAHAVSHVPAVLQRSLENYIIPRYYHLKSWLGSDENVVPVLRRNWGLLYYDYGKKLFSNIELLKEHGLSVSHVVMLLKHYPEVLTDRNDRLAKSFQQVKAMGFDLKKLNFVLAAHAILGSNKVIWERSYEIYTKTWGWSKDDVLIAFRKNPNCMIISEKKIMQVMHYFVDVMGWPANSIAKCPNALLFSLEKRIKPRCKVVKVLNDNGVINKDNVRLATLMCPSEAIFLKSYVYKYLQRVPLLMRVYEGEVGVPDVGN